MRMLPTVARRSIHDDEGATMVEYALLVALIAVVVIGAISLLGTAASTKLNTAAQSISAS
ncbi:MAG: Flp family type IVb pilin [Gemmatirosa sp.]